MQIPCSGTLLAAPCFSYSAPPPFFTHVQLPEARMLNAVPLPGAPLKLIKAQQGQEACVVKYAHQTTQRTFVYLMVTKVSQFLQVYYQSPGANVPLWVIGQ